MCHVCSFRSLTLTLRQSGDSRDLDSGQLLAMALATSNAGLVLILHDADLRTLGFIVDNLSLDADVGEILGTEDNLGAVHNESNREFHGFALLSLETVDVDDVTDLNLFFYASSPSSALLAATAAAAICASLAFTSGEEPFGTCTSVP